MSRKRRVLAVASNGGHWVQLWRMRPAWDGCTVSYITTARGHEAAVQADAVARKQAAPKIYVVPDASLWQKGRLVLQMLKIAVLVLRLRPEVIISTGASPGYFALAIGRILGAKTVWVDSIANAEELSLSGQKVGRFADLWLTQWEDVSRPEGPRYKGSVI